MSTKIVIELDRNGLADLIARHFAEFGVEREGVTIEVKSKQNYKSEWESADFRATAVVVRP